MKPERNGSLYITALMILAIISAGVFINPEPKPEEPLDRKIIRTESIKGSFQAAVATIPEKPNMHPQGKEEFEKVFKPALESVILPTTEMKLTSLGEYYITAYSPEECGGSWTTASGATCHRSSDEDRLTIPTTCAIDKSLHNFGDLFYIPAFDRVFIAEDTGSAVKGKHLDLFYTEYSQVVNFPTGKYEVYSVEFISGTEPASKYDVTKIINQDLINLITEEET